MEIYRLMRHLVGAPAAGRPDVKVRSARASRVAGVYEWYGLGQPRPSGGAYRAPACDEPRLAGAGLGWP